MDIQNPRARRALANRPGVAESSQNPHFVQIKPDSPRHRETDSRVQLAHSAQQLRSVSGIQRNFEGDFFGQYEPFRARSAARVRAQKM